MAGTVHLFPRRRSAPPSSQAERQELTASLNRTGMLISQAYTDFNTTCDHDLIESYVFEINALRARYNYLLRRIKALDRST